MKTLFISESSGYGRFVTVTVNGKPYTVPVGVNLHYEVRTGSTVATRVNPADYIELDNAKGTYTATEQEAETPNFPVSHRKPSGLFRKTP